MGRVLEQPSVMRIKAGFWGRGGLFWDSGDQSVHESRG
jgi:hypothetical protein